MGTKLSILNRNPRVSLDELENGQFTALICPPQDSALRAENAALRKENEAIRQANAGLALEIDRLTKICLRKNYPDLTVQAREQYASGACLARPVGELTSWKAVKNGQVVSEGREVR